MIVMSLCSMLFVVPVSQKRPNKTLLEMSSRMGAATMTDIRKSVEIVGEHWINSPYYADAERHTDLFWRPESPFHQLYARMDTSASVLELASGHGRHAERVAPTCKRMVLMDIHQGNLEVCRDRLRQYTHIEYYRNSGFDFWPLQPDQINAIYCYD